MSSYIGNYKDIKVIGLGQASLDFLGIIPSFPMEDSKTELSELHIQCGGPASTALVVLSRLGIETSFIGSISDDYFGKEILKGLHAEKIDTRFLKITSGHISQFAFISINRNNGKRNIFWNKGDAPFLKARDIDLSCFKTATVMHLDGLMMEASFEAARQAKQMGMRIVMDAGSVRKGSVELISKVDVLIASENFVETLVGPISCPEKAVKAFTKYYDGEAVITLGDKGSIGLKNGKLIFQEPFKVKALDTTGAGDVYHGAYIYGLLHNWDISECMRFASVVSGMKCRSIGARKGIPFLREVKNFLDNPDIT